MTEAIAAVRETATSLWEGMTLEQKGKFLLMSTVAAGFLAALCAII